LSTALTTIVAFVAVLSILVFVHELGHFTMAKLFGVRVHEFAIGFPPRLVSWTPRDTTYAINAVPLGGYVRMMGENGGDESNPESFGYKPWWQRGLILLGGPVMNILLALLLFFVTAAWLGFPVISSSIQDVVKQSPAYSAGIRSGDRIISVDGKRVSASGIHDAIDASKRMGHLETIIVLHDSHRVTIHVVPKPSPDGSGGYIGIQMGTVSRTYGLARSAGQSFSQVGITVMAIPNLIRSLANGRNPGVSGPVGIARATGQAAESTNQFGIGSLIAFVALISASLGVFNLLPIPALDGGRIVFVLLSAIRRRNFDPQVEGAFHLAGMAVLIVLVALVSYQDIANWVGGQ
jgi:regulator of sigma E protease